MEAILIIHALSFINAFIKAALLEFINLIENIMYVYIYTQFPKLYVLLEGLQQVLPRYLRSRYGRFDCSLISRINIVTAFSSASFGIKSILRLFFCNPEGILHVFGEQLRDKYKKCIAS